MNRFIGVTLGAAFAIRLVAAPLTAAPIHAHTSPAHLTRWHSQTPGHIYVGSTDGFSGAVLAFPIGANGNVPPTSVLAGSSTRICSVVGIAFDAEGFEYIANNGACNDAPQYSSVLVFAPGANGNVAPVRILAGSTTTFVSVWGVALDGGSNLYVADYAGGPSKTGAVDVFAPGANGNVAPLATIAGSATQFNNPDGIALDAAGDIFVNNQSNSNPNVLEFAAGATGNAAPIASTWVPPGANGIAVVGQMLYAVSGIRHGDGGGVSEFSLPGFTPVGQIVNAHRFALPTAVTADANGNVYVVNFARKNYVDAILRFPPGSNQPAAVIKGNQTMLQDDLPSGAIELGP